MSMTTPLKRLFNRDNGEFEAYLRREEKYRRRSRPGRINDDGPEADRLQYEIFRARI